MSTGQEEQAAPMTLPTYPDPGTDRFTLTLPPGPHTITLWDPLGRMALRQHGHGTQPVVHTEALPAGPYRITVELAQGVRWNAAWTKVE